MDQVPNSPFQICEAFRCAMAAGDLDGVFGVYDRKRS